MLRGHTNQNVGNKQRYNAVANRIRGYTNEDRLRGLVLPIWLLVRGGALCLYSGEFIRYA